MSPALAAAAAPGVVSFDWLALTPVLAPALGAVLILLVDALLPRLQRFHPVVGLVALGVGLVSAVPGAIGNAGGPLPVFGPDGRLVSDPVRTLCIPAVDGACLYEAGVLASALQLAALGAAVIVLLLAWPTAERADGLRGGPAVVVSLVLAATAGACGGAGASDLGSWLVCLELATLPAIALVALGGTWEAARGALALLTTSVVSFAMVALGAALWLVATGEAVFSSAAAAAALADADRRAVLVLGVLLLLGGVGFKLSLVPFHAWTPQAYAGGSDPVAAFLAGTSKVAALAALLVVMRPLADVDAPVLVALGLLAAVSMTVGNVLALVQDDPVRLLAWSTVAQAGWVVLPLSAMADESPAASGGYLLAYVVATLVAFSVVHVVASSTPARGSTRDRRSLAAYTGLLRSHPLLGGTLALALVSLAGLPPGVVGLVAKVVALRPVVGAEQWALALVAVANAVIGVAVYLRWFAILLRDPDEGPAGSLIRRVPKPALAALVLSSVVLVATSVLPQLVFGLTT